MTIPALSQYRCMHTGDNNNRQRRGWWQYLLCLNTGACTQVITIIDRDVGDDKTCSVSIQVITIIHCVSKKMSEVWLAIALTHIHQFLRCLSHVISRDSKIGCRYNFLKYLVLLTLKCSEVKWQKWHVFHVTVIASRERCVNMVFSVDNKVLIKSLYQSATQLVQTFD